MNFIDPKTDFAFKKIFASPESKNILISFLNALIYEEKPTIQDLEIINSPNPGSIVEVNDIYLDITAILEDQSSVIIEIQILHVVGFEQRIIYNLANIYTNQLQVVKAYSRLKPVIALVITDYIVIPNKSNVVSRFVLKEETESFDYDQQHLQMVFVELPKFNQSLDQLETLTEKWIYFLKSAPNLENIPESLGQVPAIEQALNLANRANLSPEELENLEQQEI